MKPNMKSSHRQPFESPRQEVSCRLQGQPLDKFFLKEHDDGIVYYTLANETEESEYSVRRRNSENSSLLAKDRDEESMSTPIIYSIMTRSLDEGENSTVIYGRRCTCAEQENVYCPIGTTVCRIISISNSTLEREIRCQDDGQNAAMNTLVPLIGALYLLFVCLCVCRGQHARSHVRKLLCGDEQHSLELEIEEMATRIRLRQWRAAMQHRNPYRVYYDAGRRRRTAPVEQQQPRAENNGQIAVGLKTKIYEESGYHRHRECMICLCDLQQGDRIGDLPCGHVYHSTPCLKEWIQRRNHCPLCQASDLALPTDSMDGKDLPCT